MKYDAIKTITDVTDPAEATYWTGSTNWRRRGGLSVLQPVYVLAKGQYVRFHGECGPCVMTVEDANKELKRLHNKRRPKPSYPARQYPPRLTNIIVVMKSEHWGNRWIPETMLSGQLLLDDVTYQAQRTLELEDQRRHQEMQAAMDSERDVVKARIITNLGFPSTLVKAGHPSVVVHSSGYGSNEKTKEVSVTFRFRPEMVPDLADLLAIKDPAC
jgi:hypothetical protein